MSDWQGPVDWAGHAAAGVSFAFARATEGGDSIDKLFERNWTGLRESRIVRGAYHCARPGGDPIGQARHFLAAIDEAGGLRAGDLVALDLETDDGLRPEQVARHARRWCHHVERHGGVRPFVHTFRAFARGGHCAGLGEYPLWIAAPDKPRGEPAVPPPWRGWAVHQYVHSPLDRNVFHGTRQELTNLGFHPR
ncbi:glycoside hydrolase family 25 protein [Nonomuraea angiospora]|uniref:Lysozyme n=1 Tax=Nonomuraea angiospora TaxID=46172 RepID=A0ABR9LWK6_9ACTN|nr:glycoside hydrolase family 25 protein [Nonomuraea angiospora]MBE1585038.1 lysozyme [Nonomuraea angiospora]